MFRGCNIRNNILFIFFFLAGPFQKGKIRKNKKETTPKAGGSVVHGFLLRIISSLGNITDPPKKKKEMPSMESIFRKHIKRKENEKKKTTTTTEKTS